MKLMMINISISMKKLKITPFPFIIAKKIKIYNLINFIIYIEKRMKTFEKENNNISEIEDMKNEFNNMLNKKRKHILEKYKIEKEIVEKKKEVLEKEKEVLEKKKEIALKELEVDKYSLSLIEIETGKSIILDKFQKKEQKASHKDGYWKEKWLQICQEKKIKIEN